MTNNARTTNGRGRLFDSVLDTVGDTPCIRINQLAPAHVTMYVKAEAFNPAASVKDRLALNIIEEAERNGTLEPATWDEALDAVVDGLAAHRGTAHSMFSCSKATNEVNYLAQKFTRVVMGSNNIDSCNRT